jgi:hypothetical protein
MDPLTIASSYEQFLHIKSFHLRLQCSYTLKYLSKLPLSLAVAENCAYIYNKFYG